MIISSLKLKDFRNYGDLSITPHPGINLFFGPNGAGKTNLLEAIHYCALGRSHRTNLDREVVRLGADAAFMGVTVETESSRHDVAVKLTPGETRKKQPFLDRKKLPNLSELMGHLRCVIFSPEDVSLLKDAPANRRRYLDMFLSQVDTKYFLALQQYNKAMEQRNALLRAAKFGQMFDHETIDPFEQTMANASLYIVRKRTWAAMCLGVATMTRYRKISGNTRDNCFIYYEPCVPGDHDDVADYVYCRLVRSREKDIQRGGTSYGIHREDFHVELNDKDTRLYASQGQIRTVTLCMKLAQADIMTARLGDAPVLLLDDVMSELDMGRRNRLIDMIGDMQTFITCTDESDLTGARHKRTYQVNGSGQTGRVTEVAPGAKIPPKIILDPDFT